ncbi:MAG: hypothetical protein ACTSUE_09915 [Promethearchaeota archaeon]
MGLYEDRKEVLNESFSFDDFCAACHLDEDGRREARNVLKTWSKRGYIKRISRNMYQKLQ